MSSFLDFLAAHVRKRQALCGLATTLAQKIFPERLIILDYPLNSKPRWTHENPHRGLYNIINLNRSRYEYNLNSFLKFTEYFIKIPERQNKGSQPTEPCWTNGWMPALDGVSLYSFLAINKPKYYIEVGSGSSTKFARKAINDHSLNTRIVSIDPCPRDDINSICDEIIREPVEDISLDIFDLLGVNDILYIDNSHRVFMNSDSAVMFLDVIPRLKQGVIVEIHDVTLPYDYPIQWIDRYYSEQYLLGSYLLAEGNRFEIMLPSTFVSYDNEMKDILQPLWEIEQMKNLETHGCSFWIRIK